MVQSGKLGPSSSLDSSPKIPKAVSQSLFVPFFDRDDLPTACVVKFADSDVNADSIFSSRIISLFDPQLIRYWEADVLGRSAKD